MTRVLITGSREWSNEEKMRAVFRQWWRSEQPTDPVLICGGAAGADSMAESVWRSAGLTVEVHPAQWNVHGGGCWCKNLDERCRFAGHRRNKEMVDSGAEVCFAFFRTGAGNRGTKNCVETATKAGIPVIEVWD